MKMRKRKLVSGILAILMAVTLVAVPESASAASATTTKQYPTFFCHGLLGWGYTDSVDSILPYWGMMSGDLLTYLKSNGYEVHDLSVGSVSSAWDRACEMYAQITGAKVDYGQAHSNKENTEYLAIAKSRGETKADITHARYGRDYSGNALYPSWSAQNKINLVGHSFGGPTCELFINLLADGDPAEIAWGNEQVAAHGGTITDYVSPLFLGGKVQWVNSLTTLASVLNGTTFISANSNETTMLEDMCLGLANAIGVSPINSIYDFQLEQFGITNVSGQSGKAYLSCVLQSDFIKGSDQAWYDLSISGCNELNKRLKAYDNIYYFSYAGNMTYKNILTGIYLPNITMFPMFMPFSAKIGAYTNSKEYVLDPNGATTLNGLKYSTITNAWEPNDGMVNTISARYPFSQAHKTFDSSKIKPGIWQVMSDQTMDHLQFCGGFTNPQPLTIRKLYLGMMRNIAATYTA